MREQFEHKINYSPRFFFLSRKREGAARCPSCSQNAHDQNVLVDARSQGQPGPLLIKGDSGLEGPRSG
jgi:hypothetical protein